MRSRSYIATPPGETIREQLEDRGMSQKEFATRMDLSEKHVSRLINGDVQLTQDVAFRLEAVLGIPASFWNNLEAIYREKLIKIKLENDMDADEELARKFPYNEMAKLEWVPETRSVKEKVKNLRKYFEVVNLSLLDNSQITKIVCRRLAVTDKSDLSLMAWAQKAKLEARNIDTEPINVQKLIDSISELRKMTISSPDEFCPKMKEILSDCGIALVFLPHLTGSFLQGATFLDNGKIVMGLTVRGRDADKFWFSFFHEVAHIILGHITLNQGTTQDDENSADIWARDALIPQDALDDFIAENNYSRSNIKRFSDEIGIAPGIVVGRLQHERVIKYNTLNDMKEKYVIAA